MFNAVITARLDYGYCYLHGVANIHSGEYNVSTPQQSLLREQTCITLYPGRSLLATLYFRTQFKILTYSYKSLHGLAPSYTKNFIFEYKPHPITAMCASLIRTKTYGERQLSWVALHLWNDLLTKLNRLNLNIFKNT